MKRDPLLLIDDILESITLIQQYTESATKKAFLSDRQMQDAVIRRLEIIGEAVKNIPVTLKRRHISIPWKQIAGMRDMICHEYFGVRMDRVWKVVRKDLPALNIRLQEIRDEIRGPVH
jgi:uncharacterized protein with HEPN domain